MAGGFAIVIDIGKTLSKVSLWSRAGEMLDRQVRANAGRGGVLDTVAGTEWVLDALAKYAAHPVEVIVPVAHGAAVAGIRDGGLAFIPPDYEADLPPAQLAAYRAGRDPFVLTGSPALPGGLNLGAQLHMLDTAGELEGVTLMPYAQYWAWLLTGNAVSEITSLGCHTDLWCPETGKFSPMAVRRGWAEKFAPLTEAFCPAGKLLPEIAARTGLSPQVQVLTGLHDSNAALYAASGFAQLRETELTVLSTGTWFIAMRQARARIDAAALPEGRDCLVNVNLKGHPVHSARWMGGREIETLIELDTRQVDIRPDQPALLAAVPGLVASGAMVLPTLAPGSGPFPAGNAGWTSEPADWHSRRAGACLYAALMTDASLGLIGACDALLVEGRFAEAQVFVRALASLRPDTAVYVANQHNDVALGALRVIDAGFRPVGGVTRVTPLDTDLTKYHQKWRNLAQQRETCP